MQAVQLVKVSLIQGDLREASPVPVQPGIHLPAAT